MTRRRLALVLSLSLLGLSALRAATPQMAISEIRPGMVGVGRTVFNGTHVEEFKAHVLGVIEKHRDMARDGIELRKFGQEVIESLAKERVHPSWVVPGGVNSPLPAQVRDRICFALPDARQVAERTLDFFKSVAGQFSEEIEFFGSQPSMYLGMVDARGALQLYDGRLRFRGPDGEMKTQDDLKSW